MSLSDLFYFQPYLWLGFGGVFVLLSGLLPAGKKLAYFTAIIVLLGALFSSLELIYYNETIESFIRVNWYTQSCIAFFCIIALSVLFMSASAKTINEHLDEIYYSLLVFSVLGMALIPSDNLIALITGIEMVTICGFCLTAWHPSRYGAIEASTKLVITAGVATAFLMMGIALIYIGSGTVIVSEIHHALTQSNSNSTVVIIGMVMLLTGVGFELAVVPFHNWLADFYEGAPVPVVAFIGTIGKLAVLAWVTQLPSWLSVSMLEVFQYIISVIAVVSMVVGTVLALYQTSFKRILAYSSITHFGFILVALSIDPSAQNTAAIIYYALAYTVTSIAALALITAVEASEGWSGLDHYRGLGYRCPWAGISMATVMLSLAGIPPLTGFVAKFLIFKAAITQSAWALVIIMALTSAASIFYYVRILLILFEKPPEAIHYKEAISDKTSVCASVNGFSMNMIVVYVFVAMTLILGIMTQSVLHYVSDKIG